MKIRGLTVSYGTRPAVFSADLTFPPGTMTAIIGPNGAGKSTLLKGALGVLPLLAGEVRFFGKSLKRSRDRVAYVPQRASVDWDFPARAIDVVGMGLYPQLGALQFFGASHKQTALECLARMGMEAFAERQIGQLSGGQQQRIFLARALAQAADLILLDEPFAGVDAATEATIISLLNNLKQEGRTIVCVHHDLSTVQDYFDRVALLNIRVMAEGQTQSAFTAAALQATYGGRLAVGQVDALRLHVGTRD
ncbi:MAG: metal ABC transporter ATP-binding protein [Pseudomonadota bacterium]